MTSKTLFIDLASHHGCLAAVAGDRVLAMTDVDHRIDDADVIPLLDTLLNNAGWMTADIQRIACASGPGGFTSLRVAVTLANTLADELQVPVAGVHLSDLYAARTENNGVFWLHSTRSTHLFIRGGQWDEPTLITVDELREQLPENAEWMGELLPAHRAIVTEKGCTEASLKPVADVLPSLMDGLHEQKHIVPWYGRGW